MASAEATINAAAEQLTRIADEQNLIEEAHASLRKAWVPEDLGDLAFGYEDIEARFSSCKLAFKSGTLIKKYPFVQTTLDLYVGTHHVGQYMLITLPDGEVDDTYLIIYPEFDEGGRLAEDVRREVVGQREERDWSAPDIVDGMDVGRVSVRRVSVPLITALEWSGDG